MSNTISHLIEHKWSCQYWAPEDESQRIFGELRYDLGRGLQVEAFCQVDPAIFQRNRMLHGTSFGLGKFTLIGCTYLGHASTPEGFKIGLSACYMVAGIHAVEEDVATRCLFTASHLQEFCRTSKQHRGVTVIDREILSGRLYEFDFKLTQFSVGQLINHDHISDSLFIYSEVSEADAKETLMLIDSEVADIFTEHKRVHAFIKKQTEFRVSLSSAESKRGVHELCQMALNITNLFSIIMQRICIPLELSINFLEQPQEQEENYNEYPVLISLYLSRGEELQVRESYFDMFRSISAKDIKENAGQMLVAWEELLGSPLNLALNVIRDYLRGDYNPAQHAVTCISAIEQWYSNYEQYSSEDKKYEFMLEKYATKYMNAKLDEFIPFLRGNSSLGKMLSIVRAQVLHPNSTRRPKFKNGRSLGDVDLLNISEVLVLVLLRATYTRFQVKPSIIDRFGGEDKPVLREHFVIL